MKTETLAQLIIRDIHVESCGEVDLSLYEDTIDASIQYYLSQSYVLDNIIKCFKN